MHTPLKIICLTCFVLTFYGCSENKEGKTSPQESEGLISTKVSVPAGDIYPEFSELGVPTFFNVGTMEQKKGISVAYKSILLGKRLEKGQNVSVNPIALFSFNQDTIQHNYLVSTYKPKNNNRIGKEFIDFMSKNNELQVTIENWFRAQCGFTSCDSYLWSDTYRAYLNLEQTN